MVPDISRAAPLSFNGRVPASQTVTSSYTYVLQLAVQPALIARRVLTKINGMIMDMVLFNLETATGVTGGHGNISAWKMIYTQLLTITQTALLSTHAMLDITSRAAAAAWPGTSLFPGLFSFFSVFCMLDKMHAQC